MYKAFRKALWKVFRLFKSKRRRDIFEYWDGKRMVGRDPIEVELAIDSDPELDLRRHAQLVQHGDVDAMRVMVEAGQRIFRVKSYDDGGLTIPETLSLYMEFSAYRQMIKKNISRLATLPAATESTPPKSSEPITSDTPGYGSTCDGPKCGEPTGCAAE